MVHHVGFKFLSCVVIQVDELEAKLKEVEGACSPIVSKMYQAGGGSEDGAAPPGAGGFPGAGSASSGPTVEEVD